MSGLPPRIFALVSRVKPLTAGCLLLLASLGCYFVLLQGALLVFFIKPSLYRKIIELTKTWWAAHLSFLPELVYGVTFCVVGDRVVPGETSIVISNHPTLLDFFVLLKFSTLARTGANMLIVLKEALQSVPIFGYGMQFFRYVRLARSGGQSTSADLLALTATARFHTDINARGTMLAIFPEGTNSAEPQRLASQAWARERGLPEYQHVLHPRVKGFETVVEAMASAAHLYDLTIIHTSGAARVQLGPGDLLRGVAPTTVFLLVKRFDRAEFVVDPAAFVRARFAAKEAYLASGALPRHESPVAVNDFSDGIKGTAALVGLGVLVLVALYITPVFTLLDLLVAFGFGYLATTLGGPDGCERALLASPLHTQYLFAAISTLTPALVLWQTLSLFSTVVTHLALTLGLMYLLPRTGSAPKMQ